MIKNEKLLNKVITYDDGLNEVMAILEAYIILIVQWMASFAGKNLIKCPWHVLYDKNRISEQLLIMLQIAKCKCILVNYLIPLYI